MSVFCYFFSFSDFSVNVIKDVPAIFFNHKSKKYFCIYDNTGKFAPFCRVTSKFIILGIEDAFSCYTVSGCYLGSFYGVKSF